MHRYALYARKSSERRDETEKSTKEQCAECQRLAVESNLEVVWQAEESKSAKVPNRRPLYSEMIARIEKGEINAILCWKVNRLVRNIEEGGKLAQLLVDGKIREIRTPFGTFKAGENIYPIVMECAQSAQYSISLTEDVMRGLNGHFEQGGWNHKALVGYLNVRHATYNKVGVIAPDPERFDLLRKGWEMMLTGAYTPSRVVQLLNDVYGFRTRITAKSGGAPLSRSHGYAIFRNPFYAGFVSLRGQMRPGTHKPMVSAEEFQRVQKFMDRHSRKQIPVQAAGKTRRFAYTGLMRCGYCGCQITAEFHTLSNGKPYVFYRCTGAKGGCTKKGMNEKVVEERILRELGRITIDPQLCDLSREEIIASLDREAGQQEALHQQQLSRKLEIQRQLSELASMWLRRMLTDEAQFAALKEALEAEQGQLTLEAAQGDEELTRMRASLVAVCDYLKFARDCFIAGSPEQKREIALALATEFRFFGAERSMELVLHPLLKEVVRYIQKQVAPPVLVAQNPANRSKLDFAVSRPRPRSATVELTNYRSGKRKEMALVGAVSFGRTAATSIEPTTKDNFPQLVRLLRDSGFPALDFLGGNG